MSNTNRLGFRGGAYIGAPYDPQCTGHDHVGEYDGAHLAATYTAIAMLSILGDDFSRLDVSGIARALTSYQQPSGTFACTVHSAEADLRFVYSACAIAYMLGEWAGVDKARAIAHIRQCRQYDHAYGQIPGMEGHGGSTFCAIASLYLMVRCSVAH